MEVDQQDGHPFYALHLDVLRALATIARDCRGWRLHDLKPQFRLVAHRELHVSSSLVAITITDQHQDTSTTTHALKSFHILTAHSLLTS